MRPLPQIMKELIYMWIKLPAKKKIKKEKARVHTPHSFIHKKEDKDGNYKQVRVQKEEFTNLGLSYLYPTHMLTLHNKKTEAKTQTKKTTRVPLFCYYNEPSSYDTVKGKEEDGNNAATITRAANNMGRKVPRRPEEAMGALRRGDS